MEPIIITAFWDVGRGKDCKIPRTNERYYNEFAAWAKIRNRMIIYTDAKSQQTIMKVREEYGLLDRTTIFVIEDIFSIENEIYRKMKQIEENSFFKEFRYYQDTMSNRADFDYAWMMKYWCIAEAAKLFTEDTLLAWMDFGFNHLDSCYIKMEEFDFLWNCDVVDMEKIHLFALHPVDDIAGIDSLQYLYDTFMGVFHLVPSNCAGELWRLVKKSMEALIMLDCIDDDQQLLLMAYKQKPELFEVHISKWFLPLKEFGAFHLTVREDRVTQEKEKKTYLAWRDTIKRKIRDVFINKKSYNEEFAARCKNAARRYYPENG